MNFLPFFDGDIPAFRDVTDKKLATYVRKEGEMRELSETQEKLKLSRTTSRRRATVQEMLPTYLDRVGRHEKWRSRFSPFRKYDETSDPWRHGSTDADVKCSKQLVPPPFYDVEYVARARQAYAILQDALLCTETPLLAMCAPKPPRSSLAEADVAVKRRWQRH